MNIFDIHAHIYPDAIAPKAVYAIGHLSDDIPVENDGRTQTLFREAAEAGITRVAVHSVATAPHQVASINRFILATVKAHPEAMPFAALHPALEDLEGEISQIVDAGFAGIKLHPEFQGFKVDDPEAIRMFKLLAGRLPVLLHCGDCHRDNSASERIRAMLRQVEGLTLICAHLGGWTCWERAAADLIGQDVWVDTSSSLDALDGYTARDILRGYGVKRAIFGTDYPMWTPKEELARFMALPLTEAEKADILWNNHLALFGEGA